MTLTKQLQSWRFKLDGKQLIAIAILLPVHFAYALIASSLIIFLIAQPFV